VIDGHGPAYGSLPAGVDAAGLLERNGEWF
jgi:hypothetical protein